MTTEAIAGAIRDMPSPEPYDYSPQIKELCGQLSDIAFQLERIADHLEATEGKP